MVSSQFSKDPEMQALFSFALIILGKHPYIAMKNIEIGIGGSRFNDDEEVDFPLPQDSYKYIGCLVMEAKVWNLLKNPKRALKAINSVKNIMNEERERNET